MTMEISDNPELQTHLVAQMGQGATASNLETPRLSDVASFRAQSVAAKGDDRTAALTDEFGNSQSGNNNAYCQDNAIGWVDWRARRADRKLQQFLKQLIAIRHSQPVLRRPHFLHAAKKSRSTGIPDVCWFNQHAKAMTDADWHNQDSQFLGLLLPGDASDAQNAQGTLEGGDALLILFNLSHEAVDFNLQDMPALGNCWELLLDTFGDTSSPATIKRELVVQADSVAILRCYTYVNSQ